MNDKDEFNIFRNDTTNADIDSTKEISKPILLIVDDDTNVRDALELTLKKTFDLILCENGNLGIEKMHPLVSVVILDIKMEGKNGFETFVEIKNKNPFVPIIFHSAYQDLMNPFEIINDYRPFGYVIKEGEGKKLLHTIESALDYYQQITKNAMLVKELLTKNMALQELRESLQTMVNTKTSELNLTNKELHKEIDIRKNAEKAIQSLLEEKELILREVHHRIKNNMNTLKSLLSMQKDTLKEPTAIAALNDAISRVQSMMVLYDKLYLSANFSEISIKNYIPTLVSQIISNFPNGDKVKIDTVVDDIILDIRKIQPLGIIINELLTNIMKYAFIDKENALITVRATLSSDTVILEIADNGNGLPESINFTNATGFGLMLVSILTQQLKGKIRIERGNGTKIVLEFAKSS